MGGNNYSTSSVSIDIPRKSHSNHLYVTLKKNQVPVVYSPDYDIAFFGCEKLHPFDSKKWGKIFDILVENNLLSENSVVEPEEITEDDLLLVHTKSYLRRLKWSCVAAKVTELPPLACCCHCIVNRKILRPFRYQTAGTITAARLALKYGWAINIGGGFHHCRSNNGEGFCVYADITLAIRFLQRDGLIKKAMIIDLDAHQGNGHERDFKNNPNVYILDIYNGKIFPFDEKAKKRINRKVELEHFTSDSVYLKKVSTNVKWALNEFSTDLVIYNAGTDILKGDSLGLLDVTGNGVIKRDEIVFSSVRSLDIPILMVTSGGYHRKSAKVVAQSIMNLHEKKLITLL